SINQGIRHRKRRPISATGSSRWRSTTSAPRFVQPRPAGPRRRVSMDVKLTVANGGARNQTIHLRSPDSLIGRKSGCDVRVPSSSVSRRHCRVFFSDDIVSVEDLASANGTFVNGRRVHKAVVRPGVKLQVGGVAFVVKYELTEKGIARLKELGEEVV